MLLGKAFVKRKRLQIYSSKGGILRASASDLVEHDESVKLMK